MDEGSRTLANQTLVALPGKAAKWRDLEIALYRGLKLESIGWEELW